MEIRTLGNSPDCSQLKSSFYQNLTGAYLLKISLSLSFFLTQDVMPSSHLPLPLKLPICCLAVKDFPPQLSLWL